MKVLGSGNWPPGRALGICSGQHVSVFTWLARKRLRTIASTYLKIARIPTGIPAPDVGTTEYPRSRPVDLSAAFSGYYLNPIAMQPLACIGVGDVLVAT